MILTKEQKVRLSVEVKTAAGNPAPIDGEVEFGVIDQSVVELVPIEGSQDVYAVARNVGTTQVNARADADLDEDEERELLAYLDIQVVEAEATVFSIVAGEPELQ